ncbi:MAG: DegV family EDD domain-containing protein [Lachnospiraceae bacterium]|nr:DegV family EDD domain-containing protein [Lachnospiraceae bacterium]
MRAILKEIKEYLLDWREDAQDRLFILLTGIALCGMIIAVIAGLVIRENISSLAFTMVAFFIFAFLVIYGYKKRKIRVAANILAIILVFLFFPLVFFTSGGIYGGAPIWFVFGVLFIGMILKGKVRIILFFSEMIMVCICYYIEFNFPQFIIPHGKIEFYSDSLGSLLIVSVILTILMSFQMYTYRKENEIVKAQKDEIDVLNKAQNRFFSSMSHEIRTPINTIIGLNEMILRENKSDEIAEDALNIQSASNMLLHLVNDILDMSKLQSGQMKLTSVSYSPRELILDVVTMMQVQTNEKKLQFNVDVAPDIPSVLKGDEVRIRQILINIINNAVKYTEEGFVSFSVQCGSRSRESVTLVFTVSDSGIGIRSENIDSLFNAFSRMDEEKNRLIEGTGLGLSIVKQLTDLMGGKISVNSVYTKGSTFIIELPQMIMNEEPIGQLETQKRRSSVNIGGYHQSFEAPEARVLAVDDTRTNLMVVEKLLRDTKIKLDTASGGARALKMTLENQYDVILMDHYMPEMDGIECMHKIREQVGGLSKEAAFVALTANAGSESKDLYEKEGFDGYLVKPVSGSTLEKELYRLLPKELITVDYAKSDMTDDDTLWISSRRNRVPVVITTSSSADIPESLVQKYKLAILPILIETEEGSFRDSIDIDTDSLLDYMFKEKKRAYMKEISLEDYESFFADLLQFANNIIHFSVSSKVNASSYQRAVEASKSFDNVRIVDTGQISSGQGLIALEAGRMSVEGMDAGEIISEIEEKKNRIVTSFVVDNMDFLARTNKISKGIASITKAFMIRSVLSFRKGKIVLSRIYVGSREHARSNYIKHVLRKPDTIDRRVLFITHVGLTRKELKQIRDEVESRVVFDEVYYQKASPSIATTTGPGTFGLLFWRLPGKSVGSGQASVGRNGADDTLRG